MEREKRILIVDDQPSILTGLSKAIYRYCEFKGDVKTAENGEKAINEIQSGFYDICFLDLNLPDVYGLDVMDKIHTLSPGTKVILMTAEYLDDDDKTKIKNSSVILLPKPIELDTVKAIINEEHSENVEFHNTTVHNEEAPNQDVKIIRETTGSKDKTPAEKRGYERKESAETVQYSVSVFYSWELKSALQADIIDISPDGVGIATDYHVFPGNVIRFNGYLQNRSGIVKWSTNYEKGFRAGIKLI